MTNKILITGASSGFGKLTTLALLEKGHSVVASMRGPDNKNKSVADELTAAGAKIVEIDVTDETSVNAGVAKAGELTGELDVVINNAGVGVMGIQETFTIEDWKKVFDINLFGVQRVNRAILPHFREKGSGLLVHIRSVLGCTVVPSLGPYNASKWALEALAENYRVELGSFGIDVALIEPGAFPTGFLDSLIQPSDNSRDASLGDLLNAPKATLEGFEGAMTANPEQDPQIVAEAIVNLIATPAGSRKFRTTVDMMGWGAAIDPYNKQHMELTESIYANFGMSDMLKLAA